jgi:hypothetical protein
MSGRTTRIVALLLALGMVAGFASTYLVEAGVPGWLVIIVSVLVLAVPVLAVWYSDRDAG